MEFQEHQLTENGHETLFIFQLLKHAPLASVSLDSLGLQICLCPRTDRVCSWQATTMGSTKATTAITWLVEAGGSDSLCLLLSRE